MTLEDGGYRLSCVLRAHEDDVRRICVCGDSGFATSSRDKTVRFWVPDPEKKHGYVLSKTLAGHTSFVGPLAWVPPGGQLPEGGIVSGGMDTLVLLWDLATGEIMEKMTGHQFQVTGLAIDDNGDIISSSIDCTIRRWRKGHAVEFWEAHKVAVQAVLKISTGEFVTGNSFNDVMNWLELLDLTVYYIDIDFIVGLGSSDSTLKLWRGRTCLHTFVGHADTVRGLALMPGYGILSASHDGSGGRCRQQHHTTVKQWQWIAAATNNSNGSGQQRKLMRFGRRQRKTRFAASTADAATESADGGGKGRNHRRRGQREKVHARVGSRGRAHLLRKKVGGYNLMDLPGLEALQVPGLVSLT
ncbi:hypothetical protein GW17_00011160 [Ensete ventricosum]|nr:hypothetical protein GW17_00011160 [Ensete ventricosum]